MSFFRLASHASKTASVGGTAAIMAMEIESLMSLPYGEQVGFGVHHGRIVPVNPLAALMAHPGCSGIESVAVNVGDV